ncbi:MAG TPA: UvrB/UvrC motif-containing protein [Treponemataceae bacterium]|nr:UvrB/UvrC motif-containing protein [Treponemataceae bacterium]
MKCDICRDRSAVIFVQQVSRDGSIELHLCEICAQERGFTTSENRMDISLGGLFSGILENPSIQDPKTQTCPVCGVTVFEIKKQNRVGCSECYQHFRGEIVSLLRKEGVELSYTGSMPLKPEETAAPKINPESLKKELQNAIENEDYEMAAYYRDRIKTFGEHK